ncbi:hypothetical protein ET532_013370, partial [Verminephrobacter sp. Larva24]
VGLRWPSKRIAALHRLPIRSVLAVRCALRCAPMAARSLRHLIRDTTLASVGACGAHRPGAGRPDPALPWPASPGRAAQRAHHRWNCVAATPQSATRRAADVKNA